MSGNELVFYAFSALAVVSALATVTRKNPVVAAVWLRRRGDSPRRLALPAATARQAPYARRASSQTPPTRQDPCLPGARLAD